MSAGTTVLVGTVLFAAGCSAGGTGLRDGGPARTDPVARSNQPSGGPTKPPAPGHSAAASTGSPVKRVDPVALLKADPKVSAVIKRDLKPCTGKEYPIDVSYGKITGNTVVDVVVNVLSCDDALGRGSYVYRSNGSAYENVFADEQKPVYAEIDRGDLVVSKPVYGHDAAPSEPSGEDVITYRWNGERFAEQDRVHSEYSNVYNPGMQPAPAVSQKND
ncbi:hypothetical protein EF910_33350 [Streptomyces sp. WAC07149]|uniref:hypothetical protein n=1 Tax=Streptomyces sp. WAC07149 TaxID=2487425 RepID=UPI000F79BFE4|nr:hypothetical protein [Streptomyces sp. WAC07149]RST00035.1 hypothetical protein EF910_33350 [Streptomyces sp. WAC07149]